MSLKIVRFSLLYIYVGKRTHTCYYHYYLYLSMYLLQTRRPSPNIIPSLFFPKAFHPIGGFIIHKYRQLARSGLLYLFFVQFFFLNINLFFYISFYISTNPIVQRRTFLLQNLSYRFQHQQHPHRKIYKKKEGGKRKSITTTTTNHQPSHPFYVKNSTILKFK